MRLLLLLVAFLALSCASAPTQSAFPAADPLHDTLNAIRVAGTALTSWWVDLPHVVPPPKDPRELPASFSWSECPAITADAVRALVEPFYVLHLPLVDGWGHSLEFCLQRDDDAVMIGIRSAGGDGRFDSDSYQGGEFLHSESARDIVYMNGFFFSYPALSSGGRTSSDAPSNPSFERTRSAAVARFAVRRWWRAAQLMSR